MTIRGHDTANPLPLYVHGGPGMSDMGAIRHFVPELEEHFVVVHWTQRGAGKSYSRDLAADTKTMTQFVVDLEELVDHLLKRFGRQTLCLVGQSWGTALCMRLIERRPDAVCAYVGVNQIVDRAAEELRSCLYASLEGTYVQKGWLRSLRLIAHEPDFFSRFGKAIALNPELTLREVLGLFSHLRWNMELLWPEFCAIDFPNEIPAVDVPVYFVAGAHDVTTSPDLERRYLDPLQAPRKEFILFEHSGHIACFEEPERFLEVMLRVKEESCPGPVTGTD